MVNLGYGVEKSKEGSNPGKLIVGMKEKFLFSRKIGNHLHFHCVKKETLNCEIKARLLDDHGKLTLTELGWNHNHEDMEGQIVAKKIQREMKEEFERVFRKSVREVIQVIMSKYKLKFDCQPIWQTIVEFLPAQ